MKRVMIFIGLKVAEVVGAAVFLYAIYLLAGWLRSLDLSNEIFPWICFGMICIVIIYLIVIWTRANWEWATELSKKK